MGSRCEHGSFPHSLPPGMRKLRCGGCRDYLSLGPANDTPEVLVEIRAAELAQDEREAGASVVGWLADWTTDELYGWHAQPHDLTVPSDAECQAGWLAREIYTHEEP